MNPRAAQVLKAIVNVLRDADGEPIDEVIVHTQSTLFVATPEPTLTEIREALRQAELRDWAKGAPGSFNNILWVITQKGRLADLK